MVFSFVFSLANAARGPYFASCGRAHCSSDEYILEVGQNKICQNICGPFVSTAVPSKLSLIAGNQRLALLLRCNYTTK